ncbi:PA2169 family four-helix-bundle protein [Deinococcus maricopensis]|uniref:DUF2383 domain-containing protein n=1 Tax=Deinococcus maricopensis (strain DSM 21211 / LMG 22137 / NRRL B-23946 / LB-34) TaxID=709986 RepID=E8U7Q2_DEIML|nr:PA2169 family four-helix-bundle protein [Deinococcus maricopensis]ADV67091.1 Conserved hypothetical protein CHP02284 [Deinococcus maricopensis DSM 21211]
MLTNEQTLDKLQYILGTLKDGEVGYKDAAEHTTDPSIRTLMLEGHQQRSQLVGEIEQHIARLGGAPQERSSVGAALHRTWLNVRDALTGKDDYAVVAEAERGEDAAVENYQDVLKEEGLPADVRSVIESQYTQVKGMHDRVRDLKHTLEANKA